MFAFLSSSRIMLWSITANVAMILTLDIVQNSHAMNDRRNLWHKTTKTLSIHLLMASWILKYTLPFCLTALMLTWRIFSMVVKSRQTSSRTSQEASRRFKNLVTQLKYLTENLAIMRTHFENYEIIQSTKKTEGKGPYPQIRKLEYIHTNLLLCRFSFQEFLDRFRTILPLPPATILTTRATWEPSFGELLFDFHHIERCWLPQIYRDKAILQWLP